MHQARTAIRGIAALGARSAFELHGGQSYVLGRCLPDHQGRIMSIDDMVCATQMAAPASMLQMQKMLSRLGPTPRTEKHVITYHEPL